MLHQKYVNAGFYGRLITLQIRVCRYSVIILNQGIHGM